MAKRQIGLEEIAAEVGRVFGNTESHARRWLNQRQALLDTLTIVRDNANELVSQIGGVPSPFGKRKRGRPAINTMHAPLSDTQRKRRGRNKISEETRAKMRAAAQARWAKRRRAAGGSKRGSATPKRTTTNAKAATK